MNQYYKTEHAQFVELSVNRTGNEAGVWVNGAISSGMNFVFWYIVEFLIFEKLLHFSLPVKLSDMLSQQWKTFLHGMQLWLHLEKQFWRNMYSWVFAIFAEFSDFALGSK